MGAPGTADELRRLIDGAWPGSPLASCRLLLEPFLARLATAEERIAELTARSEAAEADADRLAQRVKAIKRWSAEDQEAYVAHDEAVALRERPS